MKQQMSVIWNLLTLIVDSWSESLYAAYVLFAYIVFCGQNCLLYTAFLFTQEAQADLSDLLSCLVHVQQ